MSNNNGDTITVLLVEDHPVSLNGLRSYLQTSPDFHVVGETGDADEAIRLTQDHAPDVAIIDLVLSQSEMDGVELTQVVREISPNTQVLILTAYDDDAYILGALTSGAMGYLLKTSTSYDLLDAVRAVARRQPVLHPRVYAKLTGYLSLPEGVDSPSVPKISSREHDVVALIEQGLSNKEIADRLVISEKTVKAHVSNILQKLHFSSRREVRLWALNQRAHGSNGTPDSPPQPS
jgi:NarL family two-component system response regulator LiaR